MKITLSIKDEEEKISIIEAKKLILSKLNTLTAEGFFSISLPTNNRIEFSSFANDRFFDLFVIMHLLTRGDESMNFYYSFNTQQMYLSCNRWDKLWFLIRDLDLDKVKTEVVK